MLFSPANLPYWIFLGMGVLLFFFMIISGGGGQDVDADVDVDADLDADSNNELSFGQFLGWVGFGKAPLILLLATDLSLWGVLGWMLNVFISGTSNNITAFVGSVILFGSLMISLLMGGLIARPIGKIFAEFGEDASSDRLIGCVGIVTSAYIPIGNQGRIGQVDVLDTKRNLLTVSAVIPDWATIAPQRGEKVLIIEHKAQIYVVIAKDSPDQEQWLTNSSQIN
ncbi:OB-fold-containig protein [Nostoc sp. NZL]|uniref:OB-fold-containig protein n=1 Tax=Nostoc sp. NZL TaxID=2650612 RepID=UPI0018C49F14|nr:OB-fold-containig protein [Nostoc sp. NZL]MBG1240304.1 YqiJ family protein [Nostoc sp. NZL]